LLEASVTRWSDEILVDVAYIDVDYIQSNYSESTHFKQRRIH